MNGSSLYDYPELYDHIRTPDTETFDAVYSITLSILAFATAYALISLLK